MPDTERIRENCHRKASTEPKKSKRLWLTTATSISVCLTVAIVAVFVLGKFGKVDTPPVVDSIISSSQETEVPPTNTADNNNLPMIEGEVKSEVQANSKSNSFINIASSKASSSEALSSTSSSSSDSSKSESISEDDEKKEKVYGYSLYEPVSHFAISDSLIQYAEDCFGEAAVNTYLDEAEERYIQETEKNGFSAEMKMNPCLGFINRFKISYSKAFEILVEEDRLFTNEQLCIILMNDKRMLNITFVNKQYACYSDYDGRIYGLLDLIEMSDKELSSIRIPKTTEAIRTLILKNANGIVNHRSNGYLVTREELSSVYLKLTGIPMI